MGNKFATSTTRCEGGKRNMSLFGGGHDNGAASPSQASDFSISTINDEQAHPARSEGSPDTQAGQEDHNDHADLGEETDGGIGEDAEELDDSRNNRSPSAMSDISEFDVRPNRFRGSDRAWLHLTDADRTLAHSLDQIKADDLSSHLYSAHHLKARLRQQEASSPFKAWSRKSRWLSTTQDTQKPWYPESDWTAWPLPPDVVPAGAEVFGRPNDPLDSFTLRNPRQATPAGNLRDQLHAVMLARAHQSWKASTARSSEAQNAVMVPVATPDRRSPARRRRTRSISAGPSSAPSSPSVADDLPPLSSLDQSVVEQPSQTPADTPRDTSVKDEDEKIEDHNLTRPVFSADDDRSHHLLDPTVNHILSKLDMLLLALHKSRQAHVHRPRDGDTSDSSARSNSRSRSSPNKSSNKKSVKESDRASQNQTGIATLRQSRRTGSASASRPTSPQDLVMYDDSGEDETWEPEKTKRQSRSPSNRASSPEPDVQTTSPSGKKRRNPPRPGLRDWSEVLGTASLIGWNPLVLERTRQRCSDIFGEDMHLFTMPEYDDSSADEAELMHQQSYIQSTQSASWRCPLTNCFRNMQPLDQGFRWREHMRKTHRYDNDQIAKLEQQLIKSGDIAPGTKRHHVLAHNPRGWQPPDPLKCPHCPTSEHVFAKVSRLLDHIRRGHKYDPRIQEPPEKLSRETLDLDEDGGSQESSSSDDDSDGYMVGGVHNDGFLQPVLRHAGSRGKDLEQRAKRANARRSKVELKNAKKRQHIGSTDM
ncbi:hypothetical protein E4T39_02451 [Aureobasidium subglaciale]|nr:hypothetical protein E4T39_02451 [Aureobasidium subglaciale]